ncbi:translation-associated GTPase [Candidatus Parvarchaeota archaeon]|nr:MAG: translation-associated GTPase [Candidatus Parvarchaeota archaeon]HIG52096.1 redox-regulated ATPase YchF [Candidatus Pacearchaeota archaeon]
MLIGIVGKPNVGKSTFFKAATLSDVLIANYPFATIKPNHAMAYVKIKDLANEFGKTSNPREGFVKNDWRFVPFEILDVAGLVEGASEGKGLGNQFLDDLTAADALIHVIDVSGETDSEGKPSKDYYPGKDIKMIESELDLWYLGIFKRAWKNLNRNIEVQKIEFSEAVAKQFSGLKINEEDIKHVILKESFDVSDAGKWDDEELMKFARALRKSTKPMVIAANKIDRPKGKENFERLKKEFDYPMISCFAEGELSLRQADKAKLIDYVSGNSSFEIKGDLDEKQKEGLNSIKKTLEEFDNTGVQNVLNKIVLEILDYIAIFPAGSKLEDSNGNVLPDCFLMKNGSTALDFAYKLHTDIGKNFIKAIDIRTKRAVGKDYKLKHLDGLEIMTK